MCGCHHPVHFGKGGWAHKGDRGRPSHKNTKIVMRRKRETKGGRQAGRQEVREGQGGVDVREEELSLMEEESQERTEMEMETEMERTP